MGRERWDAAIATTTSSSITYSYRHKAKKKKRYFGVGDSSGDETKQPDSPALEP